MAVNMHHSKPYMYQTMHKRAKVRSQIMYNSIYTCNTVLELWHITPHSKCATSPGGRDLPRLWRLMTQHPAHAKLNAAVSSELELLTSQFEVAEHLGLQVAAIADGLEQRRLATGQQQQQQDQQRKHKVQWIP